MTSARNEVLAPKTDVSREAGRGGLAVAGAKAYFIVAGLAQQIALPRILGLDGYGALSTALSLASIAYNPIVSASILGVSRAIAAAPAGESPLILRRVLGLHALGATLLGAAFVFSARPLGTAIGAPHVVSTIAVLGLVVFVNGLYAPLIGALNGQRRFGRQAAFDVTTATLRTVGLVAGGAIAWSLTGSQAAAVQGAAWGFVAAVAVVLALALASVGIGRAGSGPETTRDYLRFALPLLFGQVLLNLLFQADLTLLRRFAADAAGSAGLAPAAADPFVGAYRATQLFSFLPYQFLIAVTFILFPMLASARKEADPGSVARYVTSGLRIALLVAGAMVSVISGLAGPLLALVFGREAAELGARALSLLALGFGAFALFGLFTAILNSLGRERASLAVTALALAAVGVASLAFVRGTPLSELLLVRTAIATSLGILVATASAGVLVYRTAGALVAPRAVLRIGAATALALLVGRLFPVPHPLVVLPAAAVVAGVYGVVLLATRELGRADLELVKRVLKRRA